MLITSKYACDPTQQTTLPPAATTALTTRRPGPVACRPAGSPTQQVCKGQKYDLSKITPADGSAFFQAAEPATGSMWYLKLTGNGLPTTPGAMPYCTFAEGVEQDGIAVGQGPVSGNSTCIPYGQVGQQKWVIDDRRDGAQSISIMLSGGEDGRQTRLVVECDPSADNATFNLIGVLSNAKTEDFLITSQHACSPLHKTTGAPFGPSTTPGATAVPAGPAGPAGSNSSSVPPSPPGGGIDPGGATVVTAATATTSAAGAAAGGATATTPSTAPVDDGGGGGGGGIGIIVGGAIGGIAVLGLIIMGAVKLATARKGGMHAPLINAQVVMGGTMENRAYQFDDEDEDELLGSL